MENRDMPEAIEDPRRLHVIVPAALVAHIHAWRRQQQDPPNISGAIRRLLELGLEAEKRGGKHRGKQMS